MALFPRLNKSEPMIARGWSPFREMRKLQRDFDRFFDEAANQADVGSLALQEFEPSCDLQETETHYLLSFDIPGMKKENISIEVDSMNVLRVWGERKEEREEKKGSFFQKERFYGTFSRSFTLPGSVKTDQIEAQYADGVLNVSIPKAEPTKVKQIKIGEGKPNAEKKH